MTDVLVVDDHPIFRNGVEAALAGMPGISRVTSVGSAAEALAAVERQPPDVVLMDIDLGGGASGIDATAEIVAAAPGVAVVMLSMHHDDATVFAALCAGARGYVVKGADADEVHRAVVAAAAGDAFFGEAVAGRVLAYFSGGAAGHPASAPAVPLTDKPRLTEREREVLELMAQGWGNPEIAARLFLAPKTVRNQVSAVLAKLHASTRGEAIVRARQMGFGG